LGQQQQGHRISKIYCFNSSVGILSVGTTVDGVDPEGVLDVSIPQSEFCPLGLVEMIADRIIKRGFNSSVGILSVGTAEPTPPASQRQTGFNSSVGILSVGTSPPRRGKTHHHRVSIPQSEFCPLGLRSLRGRRMTKIRFQFLSRNSVRWDKKCNNLSK